MSKLIRKLIAILDGTPAAYGIKQRGQSTVELALITPLLVILIAGIVEMGWFANNYLILLEVTRVGARRAATLSGDFGPQAWNDAYSLNPRLALDFDPRYEPSYTNNLVDPATVPDFYWNWNEWSGSQGVEFRRKEVRNCDAINTAGAYVGFYNLVLCQMLNSLDPIQIDPQKHAPEDDLGNPLTPPPESELTDDIVISVFSVQMVYNTPNDDCHFYEGNDPYVSDDVTTVGFNEDDITTDSRDNTFQCARVDIGGAAGDGIAQTTPAQEFPETDAWYPVVVGRYPVSTNECNVWEFIDGTGARQRFLGNILERDPFDYIQNGQLDFYNIDWTAHTEEPNTAGEAQLLGLPINYPVELYVGDPPVVQSAGMDENEPNFDANSRTGFGGGSDVDVAWSEVQRGFAYTGYHRLERDFSGEVVSDTGATLNVSASVLCYGSEFDIYRVQELMRANDLFMTPTELANAQATNPAFGVITDPNPPYFGSQRDIDQRQFLRPQGLVLVEIHWQHTLLLDLPAFSPVFNALGGDTTVISVWSAFPIPTAVPELQYDLLWDNFYTDTN